MTTRELLEKAKAAKTAVAIASTEQKNNALSAMAEALLRHQQNILEANAADCEAAKGRISDSLLDRLLLTPARIAGMADGIRDVMKLPDPVGQVLKESVREDGLLIRRMAVPMGVMAIIYESRPNVTSDAAALSVKSGNACVLRSGKDAWQSANAIVTALREGLVTAGLPADAIALVEDTSRESAREQIGRAHV